VYDRIHNKALDADALITVVVVLRADLCLFEYLFEDEHWYLPAPNRRSAHAPNDSLGLPHQHPAIQCILLHDFHLPVLAQYVLCPNVGVSVNANIW
jgi:hypothetical protein